MLDGALGFQLVLLEELAIASNKERQSALRLPHDEPPQPADPPLVALSPPPWPT